MLDKMPWGELKVILQLVTTCLLPRFYCFHVYFLPLHASPTQLPSCYLLTQPSLLHLMTSFPGLLLAFLHILLCMSVSPTFQKYSVSGNHNYHSCQILSVSPPSTFSCKISRHTVTLHFLFLPFSLPSITSLLYSVPHDFLPLAIFLNTTRYFYNFLFLTFLYRTHKQSWRIEQKIKRWM